MSANEEDKEKALPTQSVVSSQYVTAPKEIDAPKYQLKRITAQGQGPNGGNLALPAGSSLELVFDIPMAVHNMAQSEFSWYSIIGDQGANRFTWVYENTIGELKNIQLYNTSNVLLADIKFASVLFKLMTIKGMKLDDFLTADTTDIMKRSNVVANQNILPVACLGESTATTNYTEQQYLSVGSVGNGTITTATGTYVRKRQFKLGRFLDTWFAMDKNIIFPEVFTIRLTFDPIGIGFSGTSNVNPSTGSADLVDGYTSAQEGIAAQTTQCAVYIAYASLWLAVETRADMIKKAKAELASNGGYTILYSYIKAWRQTGSGSNQNFERKMNRTNGEFCKKVIHAVFPNSETKHNRYDHSNLPIAAYADPPVGKRVTKFHTEVDGVMQQLGGANYWAVMRPRGAYTNDWADMKKVFTGGIIQSAQQFYQNWMYVDQFLQESPATALQPQEAVGGLSLTTDRLWKFVVDECPDDTYTHYDFAVCTKVMKVKAGVIEYS